MGGFGVMCSSSMGIGEGIGGAFREEEKSLFGSFQSMGPRSRFFMNERCQGEEKNELAA